MGRIAALLTHYWTAVEPAAVRQAQLRDWYEDLAEFGPEAVAEACKEYRRGPDHARRPLPGDIRTICMRVGLRAAERKAIADARSPWPDWLKELWGPAPMGPADRADAIARDKDRQREQLRRRLGDPNARLSSEMSDAEKIAEGQRLGREWAQRYGFATLDDYADAKGITYEAACAEVCRSFGSPVAGVVEKAAAKKRSDFDWTAEQLRVARRELAAHGWIAPEPEEPLGGATEPTERG